MFRNILLLIVISCVFAACQKRTVAPEVSRPAQSPGTDEPIHSLAQEAAEKISQILHEAGISRIQITLQNHDLLPPNAFAYLENSLTAQLAAHQISKGSSDWEVTGDLSKQLDRLTLSFSIFKQHQQISTGSVSIPDDEKLRNTLAQFGEPEEQHDHAVHREMPVPTPLVELAEIPLDVTEHCEGKNCSLLLLYSNKLVERNWQTGTERAIAVPYSTQPSRAPSGKILLLDHLIFVMTNNLAAPLVLDEKLNPAKATLPSRFPAPRPGLNTYFLADGEFYDYQELSSGGLAVINAQDRLEIADHGKLVSTAEQKVGGSLCVSLPYIYVSAATLPDQVKDSILKFAYENGVLQAQESRTFDGNIYDIAITDLNRDNRQEMLVTLRNERGIFIEVHEPF